MKMPSRLVFRHCKRASLQGQRATLLGLPTPSSAVGSTPIDSDADDEAATTPVAGLSLLDLEIERDRLRLDFLRRPPRERATVIEAERKRRHLAAEEDATKVAHDVAQQGARRAQAARAAALDEVQSASSAAAKDLAAERARAEAARAALATLKVQLADERRRAAEAASTHLDHEHGFVQNAAALDLDAAATDALYDHIVAALSEGRRRFTAALDDLAAPTRVASFKPSLTLTAREFDAVPEEREAVRQVVEQVNTEAVVVNRDEAAIRLARATELGGHVARLNEVRLQVLPRLSAEKRHAILSFTGEGLAQLRREVTHLTLMARWYPYRASAALRALPRRLQSIGTGLFSGTFLYMLLLVGGAVLVASRLVTLDDNLVTIPNNKFLTDVAACANAGALDMMVQMDFFIGLDQNVALAKQIVADAITASRHSYLDKPYAVLVNEVMLENHLAVRLRAKVYVLDVRYEKALETDVTERVLEAFRESSVQPPAILHRTLVDTAVSKRDADAGPRSGAVSR